MPQQPTNGILENFRLEFVDCWQRLPNKGVFLILLAAWLALFQLLGNSTLGYITTPSLLQWMYMAYQLKSDASGTDDSHGMFIPLIVLALFWWKRKQLLAHKLELWWPGLLLLGLAVGLHMAGYMVQQPRISIIALFTGIYGLMGLAWGRQWLSESFFPFFLLAFCIPLGWSAVAITFPLRLLVCRLVELVCHHLLAIDIVREGTQVMDPSGRYQYEVAAACSGIRSLIATLALAVVYAMVSLRTWWKRGVLMASAFPLAILGNLVRMLAIVITAEIGGPNAGNYVHEGGPLGVLKLLPYVPAFAGLLLLGHWLREPHLERVALSETQADEAPDPARADARPAPPG
jgi:exosortase